LTKLPIDKMSLRLSVIFASSLVVSHHTNEEIDITFKLNDILPVGHFVNLGTIS